MAAQIEVLRQIHNSNELFDQSGTSLKELAQPRFRSNKCLFNSVNTDNDIATVISNLLTNSLSLSECKHG